MEKQEIQQMIDQSLKKAFSKRIGDTPTDTLQLANKKYVKNQAFAGEINGNNTAAVFLPTGWTFTRNGTGDFTITHNLNNLLYAVTGIQPNGFVLNHDGSNSANFFRLILMDRTFTPVDNACWFIVVLH